MATKKTVYEAPTPASDKKKALVTALSQLDKTFGKGTVMRLGDRPEMNVEAIPTGSLALDAALGIGGVPKGRIIEIYGPESSGKTTLALHILAEAQKRGGEVAFVDAEHALDPVYASALGVDIDNLLVSQPDTGEQALEITDALVRSGAVDAVAMDVFVAKDQIADKNGELIILDEQISTEQYAVGFLKGNTKLRDEVQKTLLEMVADGTFAEISQKWFDTDVCILEP